ncbi:MAG: acyl-CoA carboxylase subunit beta [Planctomycetota bacterium]|jgi:propionyl-CoA carboxylase beta chain|nr:acyl-CoA carboxylase subunit beta [Planctomycetota bacterium]
MPVEPELMAKLTERRKEALLGGGQAKIDKRHEKGQMTARERIDGLYDDGTFQEFGQLAEHDCHNFGLEKARLPGDGVVTGIGHVAQRKVATFSQDFTVGGGALGRVHAQKMCEIMDYAITNGMPVVGFNDSGGARIQEGVHSLSGYGEVFFKNVLLSGVVPQIAVIAGPCAGGGAYSPALCDFLIMTKKANMFICGPAVIKAVTGADCTMDDIGSAAAHATISGNIHFVAEDDDHALEITQRLLDFLPSNNAQNPPHRPTDTIDLTPDSGLDDLIPDDPKTPIDAYAVIERLVDPGEWLEVMADWARSIIIGFARIEGVVTGIVSSNPQVRAGSLDIDSSDKSARFIRFCNAFSIPLVSLVDVPGFLPGVAQEQGGIIRHGSKMLFAWASATVPKIVVIMRKAYGGAYLAMCSKDMGADMVFAWPSAEIAVMGAEGAVGVLYRREIEAAEDKAAKRAELIKDYRDNFAAPWQAAGANMITDVIEPGRTRPVVAMALRNTLDKRTVRPPKKHGNIAL